MADEKILYTKEDGVAIITFNRPEKMNAIDNDMQVDFRQMLAEAAADEEVKAIIITGNGRAFSAGTDVSALGRTQEESDAARQASAERQRRTGEQPTPPIPESSLPNWPIVRIPKPTIAAVNGAAVGMAAEFVALCDIRIASENARFGWVFSMRGLAPDIGAGPYLLPYLVGLSRALELMYSGEIIDAREAERIGLVTKVVPPEELMTAAKEMAAKVSQGAPLALKAVKELTYGSLEWPPNVHLGETHQRFRSTNTSEDCREGIRSFLEKRAPVWKGK
ncbi:MAG TPA: enoyl-CoA hydratase/isomerase family protein [Dehalococcoidia bacterium]|nr:enoyl-CoA hydratase/isomerase family protein [Dehalococcoidia bacterium]